ncbi:MAG TPA: phosphoribosylformylglycinamidine cyclo-ligase [Candidatus Cloacimonas sp.]|nr:phosphoribosylformylglycinamidine cyclo-ligase [Candidatus Cloacimonas sp.]
MDILKDSLDYRSSGVDIAAGEKAVTAIKHKVKATYNSNVLSELGSFGGLYQIDKSSWQNPILVSSNDGVGTKLLVAILANEYKTIGQDLVNHCVNDILVQGAIPQFFLDYIGLGKLIPARVEDIIEGMVVACKQNSCALIGGEMAEMPGIYKEKDFDLVGTIVGIVEREQLLPRAKMKPGDKLIALPSSGLHTNGYSLVRKIVFEKLNLSLDTYIPDCETTLGELLLRVHRSYLPLLKDYLTDPSLLGLAHITGGGIAGNLKRILPDNVSAIINLKETDIPPFFKWLQEAGKVDFSIMKETFNLGIGMLCVVDHKMQDKYLSIPEARCVGELVPSDYIQEKIEFDLCGAK